MTLTLADEIDVSRGDILVHPERPPRRHDVDATLVWMHEDEMVPGKQYLFRQINRVVHGRVSTVHTGST